MKHWMSKKRQNESQAASGKLKKQKDNAKMWTSKIQSSSGVCTAQVRWTSSPSLNLTRGEMEWDQVLPALLLEATRDHDYGLELWGQRLGWDCGKLGACVRCVPGNTQPCNGRERVCRWKLNDKEGSFHSFFFSFCICKNLNRIHIP